jgi:NADH-quinone oxidoreductase subunit J
MTLYSSLFYLLALLILAATALTITSRSLVHAVVYLVISFLGTAMLFYLLGAPMLAALEVIIYAGAIMVLFLIVVMLMPDERQEGASALLNNLFFLIGVGGLAFALVLLFFTVNPVRLVPLEFAAVMPREFGLYIFNRYWLAVEIISFLLFVALVGAYYLGRDQQELQNKEEAA